MAWQDELYGAQRDAAAAVTELFNSYGLGSLAQKIVEYAKQGYAADTMSLLLQASPEYQQRFAANIARQKKGLPVLSPAEYLATEKSYRQIMSNAGLPVGFYDQPEDFQAFLENDLAPQEVQNRVQQAAEFVDKADPLAKQAFSQWYTRGDMIAYALDPARATSAIERAYQASQMGGYATAQGFGISQATAEDIARLGLSRDAASQGFASVGSELGNAQKLAQISGDQLTVEDLLAETFKNDSGVAQKRQRLASQERGRFGGSSAANVGTVSTTKRGAL